MTIVDILTVVKTVTNVYVGEGYVTTRVFTPEQDLSKGTLRFKVIEGRTQSVNLSDNGKERAGLDTAFPFLVGERLYIRDIEQGLDQINRHPRVRGENQDSARRGRGRKQDRGRCEASLSAARHQHDR